MFLTCFISFVQLQSHVPYRHISCIIQGTKIKIATTARKNNLLEPIFYIFWNKNRTPIIPITIFHVTIITFHYRNKKLLANPTAYNSISFLVDSSQIAISPLTLALAMKFPQGENFAMETSLKRIFIKLHSKYPT